MRAAADVTCVRNVDWAIARVGKFWAFRCAYCLIVSREFVQLRVGVVGLSLRGESSGG